MVCHLHVLTFLAQGIFSEIGLEGDAQNELQQTEFLQSRKTGNHDFLFYVKCEAHF